MNNKIYPIGIQNFEKIRKDGYAYVDKTALVYQLVKSGSYFFLSRPRRFGKSLLISTLEAYFQGKRELFKGLAMERLEKDWVESPVLHLDLSTGKYDAPDSLNKILNDSLTTWENRYGACSTETTLALRFAGILKRAAEKTEHRVVLLIDEYNKPLLQAIANEPLQQEYLHTLKSFYNVLKTMDDSIKFALLTGVTKLGKTTILDDFNRLNDISMDADYFSLCGITDKEMHANFEEKLHELAGMQDKTYEETYHKLKQYYDGYHFSENSESVYNPFSLLNTFYKMKFGTYCFETGAPVYLADLLKRNHYDLEQLLHVEATADILNDDQLLSLFFQSGCLTLKGQDKETELYRLDFPNREVEEGFYKFLMPFYTRFNKLEAPAEIMRFVRDIERGQPEAFLRRLQSFFIGTPQPSKQDQELQYKNILFITSKLVGFCMQAEYHTFEGGMNLVLKTTDYIYIMEFKLDGISEEAIRQIEEKQYAAPFKADSRQLFKIGLNFSSKMQGIGRWIVE